MLGVDVSKHQGNMNWAKTVQAGAEFAVARATVGDYYLDTQWENNYAGATAASLIFGAYHVVVPGLNPQKQVDKFLSAVDNKNLQLPLVLDCEMTGNGVDKAGITACIEKHIKLLTDAKYTVMIYTSAGFWNSYVLQSSKFGLLDLWVANYVTNYDPILSRPMIPRDWKNTGWKIWQYSADGNNRGHEFGAEGSYAIDLDRFDGTREELLALNRPYVAYPTPPAPVPMVAVPTATLDSLRNQVKSLMDQLDGIR